MKSSVVPSQQTDTIRSSNRLELLTIIRKHGQISRAEIKESTTLSPASITNITTQLLQEDVIRLADGMASPSSSLGRPRTLLELNPALGGLLSVLVSFNGIWVELIDYAGTVIGKAETKADVSSLDGPALCQAIVDTLATLPAATQTPPWQLAVTAQGVTSADNSRLLWSPILLDDSLSFTDHLKEAFGCPVLVFNDTKMLAYDQWVEHGQDHPTFGVVLLSYGIGMGLYLNGELFRGAASSGTEIGHMPYQPGGAKCRCGKLGCIEAYASDYAIYRAARGLPETELIVDRVDQNDISAILEAAEQRDGPERQALTRAGKALGFALASVFTIFDVFPIQFVGPAARFVPFIEPQMRLTLQENFRARSRVDFVFHTQPDDLRQTLDGARSQVLSLMDHDVAERRLGRA